MYGWYTFFRTYRRYLWEFILSLCYYLLVYYWFIVSCLLQSLKIILEDWIGTTRWRVDLLGWVHRNIGMQLEPQSAYFFPGLKSLPFLFLSWAEIWDAPQIWNRNSVGAPERIELWNKKRWVSKLLWKLIKSVRTPGYHRDGSEIKT